MKIFLYFVLCHVYFSSSSAKPEGYNKRQDHGGHSKRQDHKGLTSVQTSLFEIRELREVMDDAQLAKFVREVSWLNCGDETGNHVFLESQGPDGTIESPGYPEEYPTFSLCDYLIIGKPDSKIKIEFEDFDVEAGEGGDSCNWDYLAIYDGMSSEYEKLAQVCGADKPEPITSTGNALYIKFKSDEAINMKGFKLKYIFE